MKGAVFFLIFLIRGKTVAMFYFLIKFPSRCELVTATSATRFIYFVIARDGRRRDWLPIESFCARLAHIEMIT